jgi:hypothetical protein
MDNKSENPVLVSDNHDSSIEEESLEEEVLLKNYFHSIIYNRSILK